VTTLNDGYERALDRLERQEGARVAMIVKTVITSKQGIAELEHIIEAVPEELRQVIINYFLEQISDGIAGMCMLVGKKFKADILPLVNRVTEEATDTKGRHLQ
jgi:hypothetical protein